ncbi:MAG: sigma-70 family RNA polymerase sigma factor [Sphaerospermopsis sp. SIO1G1]|nr:sigma-70 family RNA polymerase sigma factor [Sphaerospermopsis sp. SIO1G1]
MDKPQKTLENLALEAQRYPARSKERQICLTKLTNGIMQKSNQLRCQNVHNFPLNVYQEVFNEALQQTFLEIFEKIDDYDLNKALVMGWFKFLLDKRFKDACNQHLKRRRVTQKGTRVQISDKSLDVSVSPSQPNSTPMIDTIEQPPSSSSNHDDWEKLRNLIKKDPTGDFTSAHIKNHPKATFKAICLQKFAQKSLKDISTEWGIPVPTLYSFYKRQIKKFAPIFKEHL